MGEMIIPVNGDAQQEVRRVLAYLGSISGKQVILGQHTQTMKQEELAFIQETTGQLPALCGFELLAYSPNINFRESDKECLKEVYEAQGTLEKAWEWAERKGLITFTWHWFSPLYGKSKSFYTENTTFDAAKAVQKDTDEYKALCSDMDYMAGLLKPFCDARIPILWRPFHECDGDWFWWGSRGAEVVKQLYRLMYERFTYRYHLNNLIWVFNAADGNCYPGDDVVDMISIDTYPAPNQHTACVKELQRIRKYTSSAKRYALGEVGSIPDVQAVIDQQIPWTYYMTWSNDYGKTEKFTSKEMLRENYGNPNSVTLEKLPGLYG